LIGQTQQDDVTPKFYTDYHENLEYCTDATLFMSPNKILVCILFADLLETGSRTPQVIKVLDCGLGKAAG
jgi:hypothetical protein